MKSNEQMEQPVTCDNYPSFKKEKNYFTVKGHEKYGCVITDEEFEQFRDVFDHKIKQWEKELEGN